MKKYAKRGLGLLLTVAMIFSLAACGNKQDEKESKQPEKETKEFLWVPEFINATVGDRFYDAVAKGDKLYYMDYQWDAATETSSYSLVAILIEDGSESSRINFSQPEEESEEEKPANDKRSGSSRNVSRFMIDEQGNVITVETVYHWTETSSSREYLLCKYNPQGERLFEQDFSGRLKEDDYLERSAMDGEGRIYLTGDSTVYLFDAECNYQGTVDMDGGDTYTRALGPARDGRMFLLMDNWSSNKTVLQEIDFDKKSLGQSYEMNLSVNSNTLALGVEKSFLLYDSNGLYEYDLETQTSEMLLDWLDCDINGSYVNLVHSMDDGRIFVAGYDWGSESADFTLLTKKPAAEVPEKITLVLGSYNADYRMRNAIVNFNKSNDRYHISMRSYFDNNNVTYSGDTSNYEEVRDEALTRMNNDITSDNCPDLLLLNSSLDTSRYAKKGVFEDLGVYLDNSTKLNRSDFFENVLEGSTYDGVLVAIPKTFTINTIAGKTSDLGTEPGWTMAELLAFADKHPGADLFANCTKSNALSIMLQYNLENFVDWESGKCTFDQEEFVNILEFAARFPESFEYDEDAPSYPVRIANGEVLLEPCYIYDFNSIQVEDAIFGGEVAYIGYPNSNGDSGTYLETGSGLAITTKCSDKEGAWTFMEYYLSSEQERYSSGFPSNKKAFAEARAKATEIKYILDENGEKVLDENGEPMMEGAGGGIGYGNDWMYNYHVTTDDEADRLEALIKIARTYTGTDSEIMKIITEETEAFFKGQRSAEDVARNIQNRAQLYVNENM